LTGPFSLFAKPLASTVNNVEETMKKLLALTAGIALAMASALISAPLASAAANISEVATIDHSMRASKLIGMTVYNDQGTGVGKMEEILVTTGAAEPSAILSVGDRWRRQQDGQRPAEPYPSRRR